MVWCITYQWLSWNKLLCLKTQHPGKNTDFVWNIITRQVSSVLKLYIMFIIKKIQIAAPAVGCSETNIPHCVYFVDYMNNNLLFQSSQPTMSWLSEVTMGYLITVAPQCHLYLGLQQEFLDSLASMGLLSTSWWHLYYQ